ncbi:response regulator transcription factor [Polaromonas sp.]|jgi:two-component system invasion response regulator UvrY|uniref:response regulator transcription factor n=1 Tax=Polaromonas sp. TaxID=1869339 RepID=UPI002CF029F3|nr:response regulator transcription factor [Polaromonas sp.]HQS32281.1 response regulator transcription factor [Polaromonas sp.]HQS91399.1 response regulator transcription factor [Polaromonas sp.]
MLVDDHAVVRTGFRMLLQACDDIEVTAEADSGEAACQMYESVAPDVVVMDIAMAGMGGIEAIKRLMAKDARARILALSAHEDTSHPRRALQAGALGYLSKRSAPEVLIDAIRAIARGQRYLDAQIAQRMAVQAIHGDDGPMEKLSPREFEVFVQLARGQSVAQISEALTLSSSTVGTHLYNIKQKLGLVNQAEMTLLAVRHGLIDVAAR